MRDHRTLEAWREARTLARLGIQLAQSSGYPRLSAAFSQLQRASLSVQLNIAEGYARFSRAQFHHSLTIAYGSAIETSEILELLVSEGLIERASGETALASAGRCQRLLLGLLKKTRPERSNPR